MTWWRGQNGQQSRITRTRGRGKMRIVKRCAQRMVTLANQPKEVLTKAVITCMCTIYITPDTSRLGGGSPINLTSLTFSFSPLFHVPRFDHVHPWLNHPHSLPHLGSHLHRLFSYPVRVGTSIARFSSAISQDQGEALHRARHPWAHASNELVEQQLVPCPYPQFCLREL